MRLIQEKSKKKTEELKSSSTATGNHMQGWDIKKHHMEGWGITSTRISWLNFHMRT
jgi:hypothetical protein